MAQIKEQILSGALAEGVLLPFHENLTANHVNKILKQIYATWEEATFFSYLDRFHLPRKKKLGEFSKGMQMKFQIATALSHQAELLIMDEATAGLDPVMRSEMLDVFQEYMQDENHSILMSSHITSDLERVNYFFCQLRRSMQTGRVISMHLPIPRFTVRD